VIVYCRGELASGNLLDVLVPFGRLGRRSAAGAYFLSFRGFGLPTNLPENFSFGLNRRAVHSMRFSSTPTFLLRGRSGTGCLAVC